MPYDSRAAERAIHFFENLLVHVKGDFAGKPFKLLKWEADIIRWIFGLKNDDGTRLVRIAYIEVPRKQGKSTFAAGIALYLLVGDKEPGCEVYSCAGDREQAAYVFELARQMVAASPVLSGLIKPYRRSLVYPEYGASYKVLSADAFTKHGLNAHGVIFDELHVQPNRELWDVMKTSTGARLQPLIVAITTAGFDRNSICWEIHEYAEKILKGVITDPTFCAVIRKADEEADWTDPKVWKDANPSFGVAVPQKFYEDECRMAQETPASQNAFRRLYLDQWVQAETRWIDLAQWDATAGMVVKDKLKGQPCYLGLDLSSVQDLTAIVQVFPGKDGKYRVIPHFFIPRDTALAKEKKDRVPYTTWAKNGYINLTPGNVIDYDFVEAKIDEIGRDYKILEVGYDRYNADMIVQHLQQKNVTVVNVGMGFVSMNAPSKFLESLILQRRIVHGAHPVLRWNVDNVVVRMDAAGNIKPDKEKSTQKIDGVVALVLSLARAMPHEEKPIPYQDRGITFA